MKPAGLIVLEGCDATAKTSTARQALLTWARGGRYLHCTRKNSPEAIQAHVLRMFLVAARYVMQGRWVFMDRWWPSDIVYSEAFARQPASYAHCQFLAEWFEASKLGGYVFCYDTHPQRTVERHAKTSTIRPEMYANVATVAKRYTEFCLGARTIGPLTVKDANVRILAPFEDRDPDQRFEEHCYSLLPYFDGTRLEALARMFKIPPHTTTHHHTL